MKAYFLDIDNTLLDFDEYVKCAMKDGFQRFEIVEYEPWMYETFIRENNKLWRQIEEATLTFEELKKIRWNIVFRELGLSFDGPTFEEYFRAYLHESAIPVPGAYELLEFLQGKGIICAASNGPYDQQIHRLELADMRKYFDYCFVSEKIGVSKPAKEFFERGFAIMNEGREKAIRPEECLMIGDSLTSDIAGGIAAGMKTCFYERKPGSHVFAEGVGPDYVITDLKEIKNIVK